jgi:MSHA biogenesis protein MshM
MPLETLEALRLLTNLETGKRKLLQIVMFGQPELDRKLGQESIRQLNQRISFHYDLGPLTRDDLEFYVSHRLSVAGFTGSRLFNRDAVRSLYEASGGIPRLVNILAHKSLMLTFGEGKQLVSRRHVKAAAVDTGAAKKRAWSWSWSWPWAWMGVCSLLIASASMGWVYFR